jgi:hypothetical protein
MPFDRQRNTSEQPMPGFVRLLHVCAVLFVCFAAFVATTIVAVSLFTSIFVIGEAPQSGLWLFVPLGGLALSIAAAIVAIIIRIRWRWLGLAAAILALVFGWFAHDDPAPPPLPDLGLRVGTDDPGYRTVMWLSETSPYSRLRETGAPASGSKDLWLPSAPENWADHVQKHGAGIVETWNANEVGRAWITALDEHPPGGVWSEAAKEPILAFQPLRETVLIGAAQAFEMALNGEPDQGLQVLVPLIRATHNLQRTGGCLIHQMIANVAVRQCYRVADAIVARGGISDSSRAALRSALETAPPLSVVIRNAILGDQTVVHDVFERLRHGEYLPTGRDPSSLDRSIQVGMILFGKYTFNPNRTERLIASWYEQISAIGIARDSRALDTWLPDWGNSSQLKNPAGRLLCSSIIPAFKKPLKNMWEAEDQRLALLQKLSAPKAAPEPPKQ